MLNAAVAKAPVTADGLVQVLPRTRFEAAVACSGGRVTDINIPSGPEIGFPGRMSAGC